MLKSAIHRLSRPSPAVTRRLCTPSLVAAAETAETRKSASRVETPAVRDWKPLYRRLSELGGAPEGSVTRVLNKWTREGKSVTAIELIKYVKQLRKYKRFGHALEIMDWMVKTKGMNMSYTNHAIRLDLIAKVKGTESAEKYFSSLPELAKSQQTYGSLLNCYCTEKNVDKAISLYNEMKERNLASNTLVHNNLMKLYRKVGEPEKVVNQFMEMKASNIVPDNFTYCVLMSSYALLNDIDSVERVIKEAEDDDVILQWPAYSTLAGIYNAAGLFNKAGSALKKVEELTDKYNREPFHFLLSLYAGAGKLADVNRIWQSYKNAFNKPINMGYLTMLQALSKLNDINGMEQIYEEWESTFVNYDLRLSNVILSAYLRKGMIDKAESLWERAASKGAVSSFNTCDMFLDYYLKNGDRDSSLRWLEMASSKQYDGRLDEDKVNRFLKYFSETKDVEGVERFCVYLRKLKSLDSNIYEALLEIYAASGIKKPSLHQQIKEDVIELSSKAKKLLEKVC